MITNEEIMTVLNNPSVREIITNWTVLMIVVGVIIFGMMTAILICLIKQNNILLECVGRK